MQVTLSVISGPQTGRVFTFDQHETFMIGRGEDSNFCLPQDRFFSRHHCILEIAPPQCFLRDLGSLNGTYVNGSRVETAHLKNGDRIQGGETILEVGVTTSKSAEIARYSIYSAGFTNSSVSLKSVGCLICHNSVSDFSNFSDGGNERMTFVCPKCREQFKANLQTIPNYEMIRILGQGGMGNVMLARSNKDGRLVAIKTLLPEVAVSEQSLKRFLREIEVAASLQHPHIVSYIEHGTHNGIVYLVTEFVGGMDASKLAKHRGGKLNYEEVVKIIEQTLAALDFAHQQGFVHRDIKEQNILVEGNFPNYRSKLTDFGLAKSFKQSGMSGVTMVGDVAGTIAYMPPEQVRDFKAARPISDIYACGMTAYCLLTGTHALDTAPHAGIAETISAILEKPTVPIHRRVRNIPHRIAAVIETAIAKDVGLRWRTAGEMREALIRST